MEAPVIVLSRELPGSAMDMLAQHGLVRVADGNASEEEFAAANIYVSTALDPVPASLIDRFNDNLGLIANIGIGTDNIDLSAAAARGIMVTNTPVVTEDTADLTMALLLAACRKLSVCERRLRLGDWAGAAGQLGQRVHGKTLGIIGFGAIGQAVARRAKGFGMNICYFEPERKPEVEKEFGASFCENIDDLLVQSDVVTLHCVLIPQTHHILNAERLGKMKPGAVLINAARGPLIDESALITALKDGQLGGAGLDVFEFEPKIAPELLALENVTLLPHIGSATGECRQDMVMSVLANIQSFIESGKVLNQVHA